MLANDSRRILELWIKNKSSHLIGTNYSIRSTIGLRGGNVLLKQTIYKVDFNTGNTEWATVKTLLAPGQTPTGAIECWQSWSALQACIVVAPTRDGQLILSSPWWLDPNHKAPGAGYLSLLAYTYLGSPQSPVPLDGFLNLSNAFLHIVFSAEDLRLRGGDLLFWFQVRTGGKRYSNFA